jgi:hypothetical protein
MSKTVVSVHAVYRLHSPLLCIDRETRKLVSLEAGSVVTYVAPEADQMVAVSFVGREILAFAADLEERAEAVRAAHR